MILVDVNLLLYAVDDASEFHVTAKSWLDSKLSGDERVGLPWTVLLAFLRLSTNPRLYARPLSMTEAIACVQGWLGQECVVVVEPLPGHWELLSKQLIQASATGNLAMDAHLEALAMQHQCVLCSNDADFGRFPGLRGENPVRP